ncbi:alpha-methylacyl-CoA racemase [Thermocatellispora tengchongensis]|uniref:Alpha-methylacyl-CoA racemase n=1 Tax=Thermocatellispora tengchongensis TaxID=1073253 RepID=A0A840PC93_9ACTN|nr:CaiB/BaiF CoA-transferase family protein [Thermocatellispora tengchongensis]MBB5136862.1 alpha-methylacyl-CoA racemase [Thermocatellispora tengchongensis]
MTLRQGGPLAGLKVIELSAQGPVPFAATMLADMGADVIRVDRVTGTGPRRDNPATDVFGRSRRSIALDLKDPRAAGIVLDLAEGADALLEGFRPGVVERLGVGPGECMARNPALVYGRMTGWGQEGPYAAMAGHDINYLAPTGALHAIGARGGPPVPPLNLLADYGGGGMFLAFGIVCAVLEARASGRGQVIDAAMADGVAMLTGLFYSLAQQGRWSTERGTNLLDSGAHFYGVYETADGEYISVGAIEPRFYARLVEALGLDPAEAPQHDRTRWESLRKRFAEVFATRTRAEWCETLEGTDVCFAPVLSLTEAPSHPHLAARGTFVDVDGVRQPAPAPRFGRTAAPVPDRAPVPGEHTAEILAELGLDEAAIARLRADGVTA